MQTEKNERMPMNTSFRQAAPDELAVALQNVQDYTLTLFACFEAAGLALAADVPCLPTLNPPVWELGHIAWFTEWYVLREAASSDPSAAKSPSLLSRGDDWFDSNRVAHQARWELDLPGPGAVRTYYREVGERVLDKLSGAAQDPAALYPYRLALAHAMMHAEAFTYTLQLLGVPAPESPADGIAPAIPAQDIRFAGGTVQLGADPRDGFAFDNEQPPQTVRIAPFRMDAGLVTNAQFSEFIADGGYEVPHFWSLAGREWLIREGRSAPAYWQRNDKRWYCRRFGQLIALSMSEPVRHVSLYEAQAYCLWIGRRLPTEAEWVFAAGSGHPAFRWGALWEWTCTPFAPFDGFEPGPYREYSAPYFGSHQVLRGASFATLPALRSLQFRNFYLPQRSDIFSGFRTCEA